MFRIKRVDKGSKSVKDFGPFLDGNLEKENGCPQKIEQIRLEDKIRQYAGKVLEAHTHGEDILENTVELVDELNDMIDDIHCALIEYISFCKKTIMYKLK